MSHCIKSSHSTAGSIKGTGHRITSHISTLHHKVHHGDSHKISQHGSSHGSHHGGFHKVHHGSSSLSHHGGHYRTPSVHGGCGGKGISISKHTSLGHGYGFGGVQGHNSHFGGFGGHSVWKGDGLFNVNEKETMKHLNDRLASYLEKVRSLEQENAQLERNIREWYERNQPSSLPDFSSYFRTIQDLQSQISSATMENARIVLQIDNARLAADDFKNKYEMELRLRNNVESDVNGLRRVLEELSREVCDLESQVQNLQEELLQMKRSHEEEVNSLRAQLGARVNVELDAAPSMDLNRVLSEIREQYENLMERNMREVESMFLQRSEELNRQMASGSEQLQSVQTEVIELRRSVQTLEIELQSQLSMKSALEGTLAETEATFGSQLAQLQCLINNVESELSQIRGDLERQNHEYKILMDQKTHLEMEIATYKRLIDGHDIHVSGDHLSSTKQVSHHSVKIIHSPEHVHHTKC
ncbi:keratin, type I cytoskeletal 19-like isoform X1 [Hyla sarda]|uniref:keratin, type I cytoskeletal 19-like isoform X1 n=2 Tax=Hyla sarda TaxID=327740 RepID=UPI0024C42EDA|nr:keratin, type I cytoskeletal 19-like isoform X1 [Hyla sarda]